MTSDKIEAAIRLLAAARTGEAIVTPPVDLAPVDADEAWAMHQAAVAALGPVVAWKTGAATPQAKPMRGEITADTMFASPATIDPQAMRLWAVEAEIAVTFGHDLPPRETAYTEADVLAAIATWHAAIEVLDSAFEDWRAAPSLWKTADRQSHGALILGPGTPERPAGPLGELDVTLEIDGAVAYAHAGGNTAGDPTRLLVELANTLAASERPIRAGDVVTTGSTTPFHRVVGGQRVVGWFVGLEPAVLVVGA